MRTLRTSRSNPALLAVILAVALGALTACATSSPRQREYTSGLFDEEEGYRGGGGGGGGGGDGAMSAESDDGYAYDAPAADAVYARKKSIIDFSDADISGELAKPTGGVKYRRVPAGPPTAAAPTPSPTEPSPEAPNAPDNDKPVESSGQRLVIYTGSLTVLVAATEVAVDKLSARAKELGGYVETQSGNANANNAVLTIRVPAEKFYDFVGELGAYGQVTQKQINAADVTKKVFDIELRLETAEKSRQRLLDLLKSATKMEEILQIEAQVRRLTDEIEGMKGELRFLRDQIAFSTLTVTFWSNAPPPTAGPTRTRSRFEWINQVGVENVLQGF